MPVDASGGPPGFHLPKQPRQASVLELLAAGLAGRTVRDRVLLESDAPERIVAERARLAEVPVDPVDDRVALARFAQRECTEKVVVDRGREPRYLPGRQIR